MSRNRQARITSSISYKKGNRPTTYKAKRKINPSLSSEDRQRINFLATDYKTYMKSDKWESKRRQAMRRWGSCCKICHEIAGVEVHHISYDNLGHEEMEDLIPLCTSCHRELHEFHKSSSLSLESASWKFIYDSWGSGPSRKNSSNPRLINSKTGRAIKK